jgi:hypothetical protein
MFAPNMNLYVPWEDAEKIEHAPYIAVFKKDNKTLIYIASKNSTNESFDAVDFCFSRQSLPFPEIAVVEFEHSDRKVTPGLIQRNNLIYGGAVAARHGLPVVYADLSQTEMLKVLQDKFPEKNLTEQDLIKTLRAGGPSVKKGEYNLYAHYLYMLGRDPYMLNNIAAALNKYDVVLAVSGEGHYRSQRLILEDMMGKPEYIKDFPNSRGDFNDIVINTVNLDLHIDRG